MQSILLFPPQGANPIYIILVLNCLLLRKSIYSYNRLNKEKRTRKSRIITNTFWLFLWRFFYRIGSREGKNLSLDYYSIIMHVCDNIALGNFPLTISPFFVFSYYLFYDPVAREQQYAPTLIWLLIIDHVFVFPPCQKNILIQNTSITAFIEIILFLEKQISSEINYLIVLGISLRLAMISILNLARINLTLNMYPKPVVILVLYVMSTCPEKVT